MKYLMKKKSLLSIILILGIIFTLCACSGSSHIAKDEDVLVGYWENLTYTDDNNYSQEILEFTNDGTLISTSNYCYDSLGNNSYSETCNYTCEDGVLYLEQEGSSISMKEYYRLSEDKNSLYISSTEDSIVETKYTRVDSPTELSTNEDVDNQTILTDKELILGLWYSYDEVEDNVPYAILNFNEDGSVNYTDNTDPANSWVYTSFECDEGILTLIDDENDFENSLRYELLAADMDMMDLRIYNLDDENYEGEFISFYKFIVN